MPNIIEQQDLLKGLPDARLAMLLQNPAGDIPPFLVAAEAQRRQAIRQQFASQAPKESVVESLTKQLARVPQNIQAPSQMPPMVPPTPPMAGVAALEQQQAMEQAAMNAQPQQMRRGGMVRRFNGGFGSFVAPRVPTTSSRVQEVADQFGVSVEEAAQMIANNPDIGSGKPEEAFGTPPKIIESNSEEDATPMDSGSVKTGIGYIIDRLSDPTGFKSIFLRDYLGTPSEFFGIDPKTIEANRVRAAEAKRAQDKKTGDVYREYADSRMSAPSLEQVAEQRRLKDQYQQFADSQMDQQPGETEDEFRARMEELLRAREPSDWEKSQRWFAMAEQFLDPSKTTMQSVASAGRAFADQSAAMAAAERQAQLDYEKGMLQYDMGVSERDRAERSATAESQRNTYKFYAEQARAQIDSAAEQLKAIARQKSEFTKDGLTDPSTDPAYIELNRQEKELIAIIDKYRGQYASALRGLGALTGTNPSIEVFTGDEIARFGG